MTQEIINKYFNTGIGEQCTVLFSTSDDRVFIRIEDAEFHVLDMELQDAAIQDWYNDNEEYPEQSLVENVEEEMYPEEYLAKREALYHDKRIQEFESISKLLDYAANHGMLDEVVYSAIEFAKSNQTASPSDCMEAGINEWIK